jgi:hypothetical protein
MKHRSAVLRALNPVDGGEAQDLAFALGLLARDVTRVIADASLSLFGVLARRIPELWAATVPPAAEVPLIAAPAGEEPAPVA